jgi:dienelactone hydrolase
LIQGKHRGSKAQILALLMTTAIGVGIAGVRSYSQGSAERIAAQLADDLANRRFAEVEARFAPDLAKGLPLPLLEKTWSSILQQSGAVRQIAPPRLIEGSGGDSELVVVPIILERINLNLRVSIANGQIARLLIVPGEAAAQPWNAPSYVDPAKFINIEVMVGAAPTALGGTLSLPKTPGKVPAVVLIHGSGPNDRDETLGPNRPFRDIAEGLASHGVAVLRYDKRTKVHPEQITRSYTVREETIDDALAAVALLAQRPEIDASRIVIVGHSLGGMLVPRIVEAGRGICAAVIMAGSTRPLPMLLVEQSQYIASLRGPLDEATKKAIDVLRGEAAAAMAAQLSDVGSTFLGVPAPYWADLNKYDPAATAAKLSLPLLILQGGRDYQVTGEDLKGFKTALAGHRNVTIREFPHLNHLFMPGEGKSRPEEYQKQGNVDPAVIESLVEFVSKLQY